MFSKVCVLWWGFQPSSTDWWMHYNCQTFYAVHTYSPYPHASFWRLYCHLQGCGAEYGLHVRLFLAWRLFDVSSFNGQGGLQSAQNFWQLQLSDNKCISMVATSFWPFTVRSQHLFLSEPPYMSQSYVGKADTPLNLCWGGIAMKMDGLTVSPAFGGIERGGNLEGWVHFANFAL